jgi:hypothetical protein
LLGSKIIELLKSFSRVELKRFGEFLESPFHNKNRRAITLFQLISKHHPVYDSPDLSKETLFSHVFSDMGKKEYNDSSMRALISDLAILCQDFLAYSNFEKDKFSINERILRELGERKLSSHFLKCARSLEDILANRKFEGEEDFYRQFLLEDLKAANSQFYDNLNLYKTNHLANASDYLTYFYLIRTFKTLNFYAFQRQYNIENSRDIAQKIIDTIDFDNLFESLKSVSSEDHKIISLYYAMYRALKNPQSDELYFTFKALLGKTDHLFSSLECYGLYVSLANCCVSRIDLGYEKYNKECFDVYKLMIEKGLFRAYPGYLSVSTFTAVLNTGLAAGEYEYLEGFIEEYSSSLNPENRASAVNYAKAQLHFRKKEFGKVLEFMSQTETDYTNFKYHLKMLALKTYYEMRDFDALYYALDSFQHFISKNKNVSKQYRTEFNNFIHALDQLAKFRQKNNDKYLLKAEEIVAEGKTASGKWLKEKLLELE